MALLKSLGLVNFFRANNLSSSNNISSRLAPFFSFSATSHSAVALEFYKFISIFPFEYSVFLQCLNYSAGLNQDY